MVFTVDCVLEKKNESALLWSDTLTVLTTTLGDLYKAGYTQFALNSLNHIQIVI